MGSAGDGIQVFISFVAEVRNIGEIGSFDANKVGQLGALEGRTAEIYVAQVRAAQVGVLQLGVPQSFDRLRMSGNGL